MFQGTFNFFFLAITDLTTSFLSAVRKDITPIIAEIVTFRAIEEAAKESKDLEISPMP